MNEPRLSLVVSTIGRPDDIARLVRSLDAAERVDDVELVLVDQSEDQGCIRVLRELAPRVRARWTTSGRGASHGRNVGLTLAQAPVVGFPDDNAWYPAATPRQVIDRFATTPGLAGLSGRQATLDGADSMLRWQAGPGPVTRRNFLHTSIMSTMFFDRAAIDATGHFDETMGVGSPGWYGAGEESDLLLRVLDRGGRIDYDPAVVVLQDETRNEHDPRFVEKMLRYGCGLGHLWRLHRLPRSQFAYYGARKVAAVGVRTVRRQPTLARADIAYLRGMVAGYTDRPPRGMRPPQARPPEPRPPQSRAAR